MSELPKGMPCRRDCPNREPGCYCELKKQWDADKEAKKKIIYEKKASDYAIAQIRNPPRAEKRRQKNVR